MAFFHTRLISFIVLHFLEILYSNMVNKWMILTSMIKGEGPKSINDHKSILCSYIFKKLNVQGSEFTF